MAARRGSEFKSLSLIVKVARMDRVATVASLTMSIVVRLVVMAVRLMPLSRRSARVISTVGLVTVVMIMIIRRPLTAVIVLTAVIMVMLAAVVMVVIVMIVMMVMVVIVLMWTARPVRLGSRLFLQRRLGLRLGLALLLDQLLAVATGAQHERHLAVVQLVLAKDTDPVVVGEQGRARSVRTTVSVLAGCSVLVRRLSGLARHSTATARRLRFGARGRRRRPCFGRSSRAGGLCLLRWRRASTAQTCGAGSVACLASLVSLGFQPLLLLLLILKLQRVANPGRGMIGKTVAVLCRNLRSFGPARVGSRRWSGRRRCHSLAQGFCNSMRVALPCSIGEVACGGIELRAQFAEAQGDGR